MSGHRTNTQPGDSPIDRRSAVEAFTDLVAARERHDHEAGIRAIGRLKAHAYSVLVLPAGRKDARR